jgi:HAD superfamily hydrolase (TIGR01509 family)
VAAVEPAHGLDAALTALTAAGTRLAVVSSSPASWVLPHLDRLGWLGRFEAVVTREDAARAKPHPDLYLMALARLGLTPEGVVVVEDSANGVAAAVAAGLPCVAMPNPVTAHHDLSLAISRCAPAGLLTALGLA